MTLEGNYRTNIYDKKEPHSRCQVNLDSHQLLDDYGAKILIFDIYGK